LPAGRRLRQSAPQYEFLPQDSPDSSPSDPQSSDLGTGPSSSLPAAQSEEGLQMPTDKIWSPQEAKSKLTEFERKKGDE
jgi:hypothetical protein